jgi:hypothetical protein
MLNIYKQLTVNQYEAALCTLNFCIDRCPDDSWNARVANLAFCQAVFHTLFFADVYLGRNVESLKEQPFHREHPEIFRDYEEMEDRPQKLMYDRPSIKTYMQHCRTKAADMIASETEESLRGPSGFDWRKQNRAELHVYNIRHIQHHAAQLSLRLRLDAKIDIPWVGSGWRES